MQSNHSFFNFYLLPYHLSQSNICLFSIFYCGRHFEAPEIFLSPPASKHFQPTWYTISHNYKVHIENQGPGAAPGVTLMFVILSPVNVTFVQSREVSVYFKNIEIIS